MEDLIVAQKMEAMLRYGYGALVHFPKSERHVMSQEIRLGMWRILRLVIICAKRYHKKTTLQELDAEIELLRRQLRLAMELKFLDFRKYEIWSRQLDEVGRIVGAWIKRAKGQA